MTAPPNEFDQNAKLLRLFELADQNGVGQEFRFVYEQSDRYGFFPRLYKWSIMYTPPTNKARVLLWARVQPRHGKLHFYVAATAFAEFYPVPRHEAVRILGHNHHYGLGLDDLSIFFSDLDKLFALIEKHQIKSSN